MADTTQRYYLNDGRAANPNTHIYKKNSIKNLNMIIYYGYKQSNYYSNASLVVISYLNLRIVDCLS